MRRVFPVLLGTLLAVTGCSGNNSEPGALSRFYASVRARFSSGQKELQRSFDAKKNAHSWRMTTILHAHPGRAMETVIEVACPDHERIVTSLGGTKYESIRVGTDAWIQDGKGGWTHQTITPEAYPCGANPGAPAPWAMMNEGRDMATVIATMAEKTNAQVTRGDLLKISDGQCQQWVANFSHPGGGGRGMSYSVCVGTGDGLPRQVAMGSGGFLTTYSDWNSPMQINPPATAAQSTSATPTH